jgi:hypothetical protein
MYGAQHEAHQGQMLLLPLLPMAERKWVELAQAAKAAQQQLAQGQALLLAARQAESWLVEATTWRTHA